MSQNPRKSMFFFKQISEEYQIPFSQVADPIDKTLSSFVGGGGSLVFATIPIFSGIVVKFLYSPDSHQPMAGSGSQQRRHRDGGSRPGFLFGF